MVFVFCFLKKSQLIIAYHYIIFLLRLRVTSMILHEFVPTIKFESEMIQSTYLHIFTDLKSKIQFGSVDLEFWVFNWYVLDLKVDLRNAPGGIFLIYWRLTTPTKLLLKTHNFKYDISFPKCAWNWTMMLKSLWSHIFKLMYKLPIYSWNWSIMQKYSIVI